MFEQIWIFIQGNMDGVIPSAIAFFTLLYKLKKENTKFSLLIDELQSQNAALQNEINSYKKKYNRFLQDIGKRLAEISLEIKYQRWDDRDLPAHFKE